MKRLILVLLAFLPALLAASPASQPAAPPGRFTGFRGEARDMHTPGFHKLVYEWMEDGQEQHMLLALYLPHGYGTDSRRWPMLSYLAGLGARGEDPALVMATGLPLEVGRNEELRQWLPMIVLAPQCPDDERWDSPQISRGVLRVIHAAMEEFAVDPARLYLTGFSDGGKGTWAVAAEEPRLFAVAAPMVSREHEPEETAARLTNSGITCLVISGLDDPKSEPASEQMVSALRQRNVDVVYAPIPGAGHFIWFAYYSQKEFYQWMLLHRRGEPPPKDRAGSERFVELYRLHERSAPQVMYETQLQRMLDTFEPYWFIDNCGQEGNPGLRRALQGRQNVYVTCPLSADAACRLETTRQLPKNQWTDLVLEVGHAPQEEWELVVRVNEQERLRTLVNDQTAPDGWMPLKLSLRSCAGQEARLQLMDNATARGPAAAYWARIKLVETPR